MPSAPCDACGNLHHRKPSKMVRNTNPKRSNPTSGLWLCSPECRSTINQRTHVIRPCLHCGSRTERPKSQAKALAFCSKECTNAYGLQEFKCSWPGCSETMACRSINRTDARGKEVTIVKTNLVRKGRYSKYAFCNAHQEAIASYLGEGVRFSSHRSRMLNEDHEYDHRAISSKFTRMVLFEIAGRKCQCCLSALDWNAPPKTWQVDHIIPVFRGGKTKLSNLNILCRACHDIKTAPEKSEVSKLRWAGKHNRISRWMTHYEKDKIIDGLRIEVADLKARLEDRYPRAA
jgi:5-methylcytosine-specific restriction endonuclease McrA